MTTQIVNGSGDQTPTIDDWQRGRLLTAEGTRTNNGTKGNPSLVADVFGDWREELLVRTADSSAIRIYLSTEVTDRKLYTLMHDPQYRAEVARQQDHVQPAVVPELLPGLRHRLVEGARAGPNRRPSSRVDASPARVGQRSEVHAARGTAG